MQNGNLFEGPFGNSIKVFHEVNLEQMTGRQQECPGVRLGERELQGGLTDGDIDILGFSVESLDFEAGISGEGNEFFVDRKTDVSSEWCLEGVFGN